MCDRVCPQLRRCGEDLDSSLPPPLDSVAVWLQRAEATLADKREEGKDHADAAKAARSQQDNLKVTLKEKYVNRCFPLSRNKSVRISSV